jgi:hypothetical protein
LLLCAQVEQQLAEAMEQLRGLGADMEKKREVSQRVKKLRKDIADRVRSHVMTYSAWLPYTVAGLWPHCK